MKKEVKIKVVNISIDLKTFRKIYILYMPSRSVLKTSYTVS